MCNRYVQSGKEVRPGQRTMVLMRGPGGEFELPFEEAVFGGPARCEIRAERTGAQRRSRKAKRLPQAARRVSAEALINRNCWIKRERAEPVIVPDIFAEVV